MPAPRASASKRAPARPSAPKSSLSALDAVVDRIGSNLDLLYEPNPELSAATTEALRVVYDAARASEPRQFAVPGALPSLLVDGFDAEQVWEQVKLWVDPTLQASEQAVLKLMRYAEVSSDEEEPSGDDEEDQAESDNAADEDEDEDEDVSDADSESAASIRAAALAQTGDDSLDDDSDDGLSIHTARSKRPASAAASKAAKKAKSASSKGSKSAKKGGKKAKKTSDPTISSLEADGFFDLEAFERFADEADAEAALEAAHGDGGDAEAIAAAEAELKRIRREQRAARAAAGYDEDGSDEDEDDDDEDIDLFKDVKGAEGIMFSDFFGDGADDEGFDADADEEDEDEDEDAADVDDADDEDDDLDGDDEDDEDEDEDEEDDVPAPRQRMSLMDDDDEEATPESGSAGADPARQDPAQFTAIDDQEHVADELVSSYQKKQKAMAAQIAAIEQELVGPKSWDMVGETRAHRREKDVLLSKDVEVDYAMRPPEPVTEEVAREIDTIIKQRIRDEAWDDVVPRVPVAERAVKPAEQEVSGEKSQVGLAEIYEREYLQLATQGLGDDADAKTNAAHDEIGSLFASLCHKLDALSNYHFTPKGRPAELQITASTPALEMEEVLPMAMSTADRVAPQEVFRPGTHGLAAVREEQTREEKAASRRARKESKGKHFAAEDSKEKRAALAGDEGAKRRIEQKEGEAEYKSATKKKIVTRVEKTDRTKYATSTSVFAKIQETVAREAAGLPVGQQKKHVADGKKAAQFMQ